MNLRTQIAQTSELENALQLASEASAGTQGILHIADGSFKGSVYFEKGRVVGAQVRESDKVSLHALQDIVTHRTAAFLYEEGPMPQEVRRISFAFQELLKDGLALVEKEAPNDPSVLGQSVDQASMRTLSTPIQAFDPSMFPELKKNKD